MCKLTIKPNEDPHWGNVATILNGEYGEITGTYETEGGKFYSAVFPIYGGEFTWIPSEFCQIETTE